MIRLNKRGFTIIELLIATAVLGILILLASMSVIGLTRQFYKGINQAKTQEAARNITDEIATNLQFSSVPPIDNSTADTGSWCIADQRYWFKVGQMVGQDSSQNQIPKVLIRDGRCDLLTSTPGNNELIPENMRLIQLDIQQSLSGDVFNVNVIVGYGGDDLFCNETTRSGSCSNFTALSPAEIAHPDTRCRGGQGTQYCAVAKNSLNVVRRAE